MTPAELRARALGWDVYPTEKPNEIGDAISREILMLNHDAALRQEIQRLRKERT